MMYMGPLLYLSLSSSWVIPLQPILLLGMMIVSFFEQSSAFAVSSSDVSSRSYHCSNEKLGKKTTKLPIPTSSTISFARPAANHESNHDEDPTTPSSSSLPSSSYLPDRSPIIEKLVSFLVDQKEGEGIGDGTEIGFHPVTKIRGLFATDDFQCGEFIMGLPFPGCLTLSHTDMMEEGEPSDAELGLRMLKLLEEGKEEGKAEFWPYYQSLPTLTQNFDATPDFWTDEQLEALEFPPIIEKTKQRQRMIQDIAQTEKVDEKQLQFATWLVKSRGFTLLKPVLKEMPKDSNDQEPQGTIMSKTVMMPYVDMINHGSNIANAELAVLETKKEDESFYAVQATDDISKGQEILLCYEQEGTADLLANYGFIPGSDNPNDRANLEDWKGSDWSTTLKEDQAALQALMSKDFHDDIMKKTLEFRIRLKEAQDTN